MIRNFAYLILIGLLLVSLCRAEEPERLYVQSVSILGAQKTKPVVILRELTFQKGDTLFSFELQKLFDRNQQNVYNLGLFNKVSFSKEIFENTIHIIITVKERWYIFPRPHFRLEERNSYDLVGAIKNGNLERFSYGMFLLWRNFGGYNETLQFYGQLGFSKRLYIDFLRPAIFPRQRIDMITGFHYINRKEVIYGTENGVVQWGKTQTEPSQISYNLYLGLRKRFSVYSSLYTEFSFKQYQFSDSIYTFQLNGEQAPFITNDNAREYYPGLVLSYAKDKRDLKSFPLKGYKYQFFGRITGFPGFSSTQFAKLGGSWAHYIPLSKRWNFSYGTSHLYTFGKKIPFFEKTTIGINRRDIPGLSSTIRGYEPYAIDGSYIMMTKSEWKFAVFPRKIYHMRQIPFKKFQDFPLGIYLTAFSELGCVVDQTLSNHDNFLKSKWLLGYGVGLNIIGIYDTLLRIEYARNHLGQGNIYLHSSVAIK